VRVELEVRIGRCVECFDGRERRERGHSGRRHRKAETEHARRVLSGAEVLREGFELFARGDHVAGEERARREDRRQVGIEPAAQAPEHVVALFVERARIGDAQVVRHVFVRRDREREPDRKHRVRGCVSIEVRRDGFQRFLHSAYCHHYVSEVLTANRAFSRRPIVDAAIRYDVAFWGRPAMLIAI
jgi:hypothetical protein